MTMERARAVACIALLCSAAALACGRDSTGPVPVIAGSYTGVSSLGQMEIQIEQTGRELTGQGYFGDQMEISLFTVHGRITDHDGGHRITMALPSIRFPEMSVSADVIDSEGRITGTLTDGLSTAQITLVPYETARQ